MFKEENFDNKMSMKFLQTLNIHLPVKRKKLKELIGNQVVINRDGSMHYFDKKELEKLASLIPEWEHDKLRLPIYLEMSSSMERGSIKISGRIECRIISGFLHEGGEKRRTEEKDSMIIYYPHLTKIRKELSTTTQYMFTI